MSLPLDARPGVPGASPRPDQTLPTIESPQTFEQVYDDLEGYFGLQLRSPHYGLVEYTLTDGADFNLLADIIYGGIYESGESGGIEVIFGKAYFDKSRIPNSAFIRLSDDAQGKTIKVGVTFEGQPSEGIELNLAEKDGSISAFESNMQPDGTEERLRTKRAQLNPDQLRSLSQILPQYSPSGSITYRSSSKGLRERLIRTGSDFEGRKRFVVLEDGTQVPV